MLDEMDVLDVDRSGDPVLVRKTVLKVARAPFVDSAGALTVARGDTATIAGVDYTVSDLRIHVLQGVPAEGFLHGRSHRPLGHRLVRDRLHGHHRQLRDGGGRWPDPGFAPW